MKDSKIVFFIQQIDSKSEKTEDTPSRRPAPAAPSTRRGGAWFNNAIHHIRCTPYNITDQVVYIQYGTLSFYRVTSTIFKIFDKKL